MVRSRFFRRLVSVWSASPTSVIDVGSGDGWFATQLLGDLPEGSTITCWDANYGDDDLAAASPRGVVRVSTPPTTPVPLVLALDVLEHIEDDQTFVREQLLPLVADGGTLVVSVPAHQRLYTSHDRALGHHRRHSSRSLRELLDPHFEVVARGSLFTSLLLPRAMSALIERITRPASATLQSNWHHGRLVTAAVTKVLAIDAALGLMVSRTPVRVPGLSVWVVATPRRRAEQAQR